MIKAEFSLTDSGLGTVAALLTIGCLIGALFTGNFTERYGRKNVMIFTAVVYIISALGSALSESSLMLTVFRVLSGLAVGATSVVGPMYISEISPAAKRGTLVSMNQFAITIGIVVAYVIDFLVMDWGENSWRYMLAVPAVFGVIYLVFLLSSFPQSPRWLLSKYRRNDAIKVLEKIGGKALIESELPEMEQGYLLNRVSKK